MVGCILDAMASTVRTLLGIVMVAVFVVAAGLWWQAREDEQRQDRVDELVCNVSPESC